MKRLITIISLAVISIASYAVCTDSVLVFNPDWKLTGNVIETDSSKCYDWAVTAEINRYNDSLLEEKIINVDTINADIVNATSIIYNDEELSTTLENITATASILSVLSAQTITDSTIYAKYSAEVYADSVGVYFTVNDTSKTGVYISGSKTDSVIYQIGDSIIFTDTVQLVFDLPNNTYSRSSHMWDTIIDVVNNVGVTGDTLFAQYLLDGDATEEINGYDGTATNVTYQGDTAAIFDGTAYITVADNNAFSFGNGTSDNAFTIAFKYYSDETLGSYIIAKAGGYSTGEWFVQRSSGITFRLIDNVNGGVLSIYTASAPSNTTLHNVAVVYDGSGAYTGMQIYIDGSFVTTYSTSTGTYVAMENTSNDVLFGNRSGYSTLFTGMLDDIRFFNKAMSLSELQTEFE